MAHNFKDAGWWFLLNISGSRWVGFHYLCT
jgi:hypothetical protein